MQKKSHLHVFSSILISIFTALFSAQNGFGATGGFGVNDPITKKVFPVGLFLPCKESMDEFAKALPITAGAAGVLKSQINSCSSLFDSCGYAGTAAWSTASADKFRTRLINDLVRQVVGVRIQNLYYGYNSALANAGDSTSFLTDPSQRWDTNKSTVTTASPVPSPTPKTYAPIPYPAPSPSGLVGASGQASGACNIFCNEGYGSSFGTFDLPTDVEGALEGRKTDKSGGLLFDKKFAKSGPGTGTADKDRSAYNIVDGIILDQYASKFSPKGVIANRLSPDLSCGSWPSFTLDDKDVKSTCRLNPTLYAGSGLVLDAMQEYKKVVVNWTADINWGPRDGGNIDQREASTLTTFTWEDTAPTGSDSCTHRISPDFTAASGMSAVHVGVLAQALWMGLESVLKELSANEGRVLVPLDGACGTFAVEVLNQISSTLADLQSTQMCTLGTGAKAVARTNQDLTAKCNSVSMEGETTSCQTLALVKSIQDLKTPKILECEVYRRAHELYSAFMVSTGKGGKEDPVSWIKQLRNWAVAGCAADLFEVTKDSWTVGRGISGESSDIGKNVSGSLTKCFRYKYTTALKSYLEKGTLGKGVNMPGFSSGSGTNFKLTEMQKTGDILGSSLKLQGSESPRCQIPKP